MSTAALRNQKPRRSAGRALPLLLLLALLLARGGTPPARAQAAHVHTWVEAPPRPDGFTGDWPPELYLPHYYFRVVHQDGRDVTDANPALPCEVVEIHATASGDMEEDICTETNPPCPLGGSKFEYCRPKRWKDNNAAGHFVVRTPDGEWTPDEFTDPVDGQIYGSGKAAPVFYRVARDQQSPSAIILQVEADDDDPRNDPRAFDSPKRWGSEVGFPVVGTRCWISHANDTSATKCTVCRDKEPAFSDISPSDGNVHFEVPITSWGYRGERIPFSLHYNSVSVLDPYKSFHQPLHPAALSDRFQDNRYNPKWTHSFAQWIEVLEDGHAVWNRGDGSRMVFEQYWNGASGPFWRSEESYHTLTSSGFSTSPTFKYEDDPTFEYVPFAQFTLRDGAGTQYTFDQVRWNIAEEPPLSDAYAVPYFLLTKVTDRWNRTLNLTWTNTPAAVGVTSVLDGDGRGLTFTYNATTNLLTSVQDPAGRTHTLTYTDVLIPNGANGASQPKLSGVTVKGAGLPASRVTYTWSFDYGSPTLPQGYGGTYTGDLVVRKTEPSGKNVFYEYEATDQMRHAAEDYDGRLARAYFQEDLDPNPQAHEILRSGTTLTYPGGDSYTYTFTPDGEHLARVTRSATQAWVAYSYDAYHNLTSLQTSGDMGPLVSMAYTYGGATGQQILSTTATDILGNQGTASFNSLNLPVDVTALATPGSGHNPQTTHFYYDGQYTGGALTLGNLARIIRAYNTPSAQHTTLDYTAPLFPGMPTQATDWAGRTSTVSYNRDGSPFQSSSPQNLLAPVGDPDRDPSTGQTDQNADELPSLLTDPLGHQTQVDYRRDTTDPSRLVVTLTHLADNTYVQITFNADGQPVKVRDERAVISTLEYNRAGQPFRVIRAVGSPDQRTVTSVNDAHGDLASLDPPAGSGSRVTFEYCQYDEDPFNPAAVPVKRSPELYVGQPTHVHYPDGTDAYAHYNAQGELDWQRDANGRVTRLSRDSLHRVYRVDYPEVDLPGTPLVDYPASSVESSFDEFGRVTQTTDANGTSTYGYDDLNQLRSVSPAVGRSYTLTYPRDLTYKRWQTRLTLSGVGSWEFRQDSKGRQAEVLNPFGQLALRRYDKDGKLLRESRPNGTYTDATYTSRDWLDTVTHYKADGTGLDSLAYSYRTASNVYDGTGHVQRETDAGGRAHYFYYNEQYELIQEKHLTDFGTLTYTYDLNGNRTSKQRGSLTEWAGYDAQNKLLWTNQGANAVPASGQSAPYRRYTYDAAGQPTAIEHRDVSGGALATDGLEWDGMGNLRRFAPNGLPLGAYSATYDGKERLTSTVNGLTRTFSAGGLHDAGPLDSTTYTPGVSQRKTGPTGSVDSFFHQDWLGSTRYLTDSTGQNAPSAYRYDAYGNTSAFAGTDQTSYKFAGAEGYQSDGPAGLQLLGARYYDPAVGRFISPDPIGMAGGLNRYAYCGNDPVNLVDPSGLWATGSYLGDVGQVFAGYGDVLYNATVGTVVNMPKTIQGLMALGRYGSACGWGAAGMVLVRGIWHDYTDFATPGDPRRFGQSFGNVLLAIGEEGAGFASGGGGAALRVRHHTDASALAAIEGRGAIIPSARTGAVDVEVAAFGPARTAAAELGAAAGRPPSVPAFVEFDAPTGLVRTYAVTNYPRNTGTIPTNGPLRLTGLNPKFVVVNWWKFWIK
jgi:RHS repeat-associated protein